MIKMWFWLVSRWEMLNLALSQINRGWLFFGLTCANATNMRACLIWPGICNYETASFEAQLNEYVFAGEEIENSPIFEKDARQLTVIHVNVMSRLINKCYSNQ
jgi:hypothetical protein